MPSADQFLRLVEERDLVSAQVLQAARLEVQRTSPPPDAVGISLWLVQSHHITASQAERLLAAVQEKAAAEKTGQQKSVGGSPPSRWQKGEPKPTEALGVPIPRAPEAPRTTPQSSPAKPAAKPAPKPAAKPAQDEFDLAPLDEEGGGMGMVKARTKPSDVKTPPGAAAPTAAATNSKPGEKPKPAIIGGELESLDSGMKGPLDSLIESESLEASPFDDPMGTGAFGSTAPKKFKLRRFIKNLLRRSKSKVVTVKAADPRQVKVLLFSWGVAVAAILVALILFWFLSPGDSQEILRKAELAVDKQDYDLAIQQYDKFLKNYPTLGQANDVRGLRVLAELRVAARQAAAAGDFTPAIKVAQDQVKLVPNTASFDLLAKLGVALAKIAEGVAAQTQAKPDRESLDRLLAITGTIETIIPAKVQPNEMLEGINRILKQCKQEVEGKREVEQTVKEIHSAVGDSDTARAYAAYRTFIQLFPNLIDDPSLTDAMKQAAALEQQAVKSTQPSLTVATVDRPSDLIAAMPLAVQPTSGTLAAPQVRERFVVEQGTVYGLDAATGKVLWRRFVAQDPKLPAVTAVPIVEPSQTDVVLCDPVHQEVLRVNGKTGELIWRTDMGRPLAAEAVRAGKFMALITQDNRLQFIDLVKGTPTRSFVLPQAVRLAPVVDTAHKLIYVVAEQSNIYVFGPGKCQQVLHLGHEKGTIAALPTVVGDFLLVPENDKPTEATIRVLSIAMKDDEPLTPVERIKVKGYLNTPVEPIRLNTPPEPIRMGAVMVTAQGGMVVIDRDAEGKTPFRIVAQIDTALEERSVHYAVSDGKSFWVSGRQLTRYEVQADQGQIVPKETSDPGVKFVVPPIIESGAMFTVMQRPGRPGVTASIVDLTKSEPIWQTWLAAPLVAAPEIGTVSGKLTAVTASGGMFRLPPAEIVPNAVPVDPVLAVGAARLLKPLTSLLALPGERYAMTSGPDTTQIVIYDPEEQDKQFRWLRSPRELAVAPAAFAGGVLAACVDGQVFLMNSAAGEDLAAPYAPTLHGVTTWEWQTPQAVDDKLAVLSDGDHRMISIQLTKIDEPALNEGAVTLAKKKLVSPIAVLGNMVYVVDASDSLLSFQLPDLSPGKAQSLTGHSVWGPQRVGNLVLVATDKNKLVAVNEQQQVAWQAELSYGPLSGAPYGKGGDIYLASQSGMVWRISAADGSEKGKVNAGCPLGTGPLLIGSRLIVGGHDGSLLEVKKP